MYKNSELESPKLFDRHWRQNYQIKLNSKLDFKRTDHALVLKIIIEFRTRQLFTLLVYVIKLRPLHYSNYFTNTNKHSYSSQNTPQIATDRVIDLVLLFSWFGQFRVFAGSDLVSVCMRVGLHDNLVPRSLNWLL